MRRPRAIAKPRRIEVLGGRGYVARKAGWLPLATRKRIYARDGNRCLACGSKGPLTLDHVCAQKRCGPSSDPRELITLCKRCNSERGSRTIVAWRIDMVAVVIRQTGRRPPG